MRTRVSDLTEFNKFAFVWFLGRRACPQCAAASVCLVGCQRGSVCLCPVQRPQHARERVGTRDGMPRQAGAAWGLGILWNVSQNHLADMPPWRFAARAGNHADTPRQVACACRHAPLVEINHLYNVCQEVSVEKKARRRCPETSMSHHGKGCRILAHPSTGNVTHHIARVRVGVKGERTRV